MSGLCVTTVEARSNFSEVINRAAYGQDPVTLTRRGKVVAAVISPEDLMILDQTKEALRAEGKIEWSKGRVVREGPLKG
jgi:prevent-host-death family protein